jgi:hypothetical protein
MSLELSGQVEILRQINDLEAKLLDLDKSEDLKYFTAGAELKKQWMSKAISKEFLISQLEDLIEQAKNPEEYRAKENAKQKESNAKPVSELTDEELELRILIYGNEDLQKTFFELKRSKIRKQITADQYKEKLIELAKNASPHDFKAVEGGSRYRKRKQRKTQKRKNRRNRTRKN